MPRDIYADDETLGRADQVYGQSLLSDALAGVRFHAALPHALSSIRQIANSWQPLPIVVSPRPETVQQPLSMPSIMDRPPPTPQTPTVPGSQSQQPAAVPETTTPSASPQAAAAPAAASGVPQAMPSAASAAAPRGDPSGGVEQWNGLVQEAAQTYGVDPADIKGLMHIESGGRTHDAQGNPLRSSAGAIGLMQTMPFHYQPGENPDDPRTNIMRGAKIYADNLRRYGGDRNKAAAAYFGAIDGNGNITGASDGNTDGYGYVQQFNAARARYQGAPTAAGPTAAGSPSSPPAADSSRSAAGASQQMLTIRHKGTGAVSRVFASTWNPRDITNYSEFEVVPDQMQKVGDTQTADDTGGLSPGDQKRQKLASGLAIDQPGPLQGQRTQSYWNPETQNVEPAPGPLPQAVERMPQSNVRTAPDGTPLGGNGSAADEMRRQPLQATGGPDSSTGADPGYTDPRAASPVRGVGSTPTPGQGTTPTPVSSTVEQGGATAATYNDPTADGTIGQPLPSYTDGGYEPGAGGVASGVAAPTTPPSSSPANDPGGAQFAAQDAYSTPQQPTRLPVWDANGNKIGYQQEDAAPPERIHYPNERQLAPAAGSDTGQVHGPEQPSAPPSRWSPDVQAALAGTSANPEPITPPQEQPTGPLQSAASSAGRSQFLNEPAAQQAVDIYSAIQELPFDAYARARQQLVSDVDARHMAGTDPLAPFRGLGIQLPSAEELNPEGRPASDVAAGLLLQGALPDPTDPIVETAFRAAGKTLGLTFRGVRAAGRAAAPAVERGTEAVAGIGSRIRGAISANAANVAAADARMAEQGSTVARIPAAGGYAGHDTPFVVYDRQGKRVATVTDENYAAQLAREHGGRYEFDQTAPSVAEPIRSTNMSVEEAQQRGYTILGPDGQPADLAALDEEVRRARSPSYDPSLPTPYRESSSPRADQALTSDYGPRIETVSDAQRGAHSIENVQSARGEGAYSNSPVPPNFDQQVLARDDVPRDPRSINLNARPGASASAGLIGDVANSLGSGVAGAGAGAALPAETDEERRRNALIGAGVGMVAGPSIGRVLPHEGGALATFGASPNYRPPTPAQIKAAEVQGARRGEMLNREVKPPGSSVPLGARLSTALTDPLAATRYAENLLTDTAGVPRLPDNSPLRASTLLRENPTGFIKDRIETELVAPVIEAAQKGLQTELPRYVEDTHQRDILDKFYGQAWQGVIDERTQKIADAQARGVAPVVIARMQAKMQADAVQAGETAMRRRQGSNAEHTYEATNARLLEQEQRLTASGTFGDLQSLAQQIWDASQKTLDNSVAAGRVEPQVAADLKAMYPHYVPTVPISKLDPGGRSFGASSGGTTVGASKTNPIHALEDVGSSSERLNPIVAVRNQIVTQERQNHQNQVFQAFAQLMDNAGVPTPGTMGKKPNLWEGERQISGRINGQPETRMVPASVANGIESMTQAGMGPDAAVNVYKKVVGWFAGQLTAARASYIPLNLARDAGDTFFNTMVKNGGPARLPRVMGTWLDEASRAVADVAAAQATPRGIVGAAGGFAYGATQVDDQNAPISTRLLHGVEAAIPGAFLLGANKNVNVSSRAANDFIARGGASGGISSGWRTGQRWYRDVLRDGGTPIKNAQDMALFMRDWAGDVWNLQGLKGANERLDLVGRTTAMRVAEARGAGPTEAMIAGRDSSYDPDKAGTILRAVNGMIPFTNATVQGGAQFARALRDHPGTTLATVAATLAPVMLGVEAWNRSDPQRAQIYDNVPQYLKDSGIVWVPPVEWGQGSDTRGSLPKYLWFPTEITTPFVVGMRGAMQHLDKVVPGLQPSAGRSDVNPDAPEWQKWLGVLNEAVQIFNPTHGDTAAAIASGAVPPVIKQTMELGLNKDLYRGNAIMSDPADERASALSQGISRTANDLGRTFNSPFLQNVRPSGVEHILRADPAHYDIASGISDQVKPSPYKAAEQGRIANEPFVGGIASRFVRDTGGANLERAVGAANTPDLQAALQDARMRPSEVDVTVPATVGTLPLNRDEQLEAQNRMNEYLPEELAKAQSNPKWSDPTQAQVLLKAAVSRARTRATTEIIRTIPKDEQNDRTRQQTDAKLAVGAR